MNINIKKPLLFTVAFLFIISANATNLPVNPTTFVAVYALASDGDVIVLDAGDYTTAVAFPTGKALTIKAATSTQPRLTFQLGEPTGAGGSLTFDGVMIDREGADYFFNTAAAPTMNTWKFVRCTIKNIAKSLYNSTNKAENISNITIDKCLITASGTTKTSFILTSQTVDVFNVTNTTVYNYVGGDFFHPNNTLATKNITVSYINNTMYHSILDNGYGWVSVNNVYPAGNTYLFKNNIFDTGANADPVSNMPLLVYKGNGTATEQNNIIIKYKANNGTTPVASNLTLGTAPLQDYTSIPYTDAANSNFIIPSNSAFATAGLGGGPVGDPRWLNGGVVLPISDLTLKVTRNSQAIALNWSTSTEKNTSHFAIERNDGGDGFKKIGEIKANGNTQSLSNYSFSDRDVVKEDAYYRVLAVDFDNKSAVSNVVFIKGLNQIGLLVYPTVATSDITISHPKALNNSSVEIFNMNGKKVMNSNVQKGATQSTIDVSALAVGTYVVNYLDGTTSLKAKMIKN